MVEDDPARAMIDWINNVPPAELAAELMMAFVPGQIPGLISAWSLAEWMFRGCHKPSKYVAKYFPKFTDDDAGPISEALQLLEHSELLYTSRRGERQHWNATRLGLAMVASGKPAVRQRITDRTGA
jgi:hypothetical protein